MNTLQKPVTEVKADIHTVLNNLRTACQVKPFVWNNIEPLFDKLEASIDNGLANFEST